MTTTTAATPATSPDLTWREAVRQELEEETLQLEKEHSDLENEIEKKAGDDPTFTPPDPSYYWLVVKVYVVLQAILLVLDIFFLSKVTVTAGLPINLGMLMLLLQVWHAYESVTSIGVNELAGFSLMGRPLFEPTNGLYLVPWGLVEVLRASRNYKDVRFPGPPDKIFRISAEQQKTRPEGDKPPDGMVRPIFVVTGEPRFSKADKALQAERNPLDRQLPVEVSYFLRFRVNQKYGGIFRVARNLSVSTNPKDIEEAIKDLMQEQSERDIKSVLTRQTAATITENWSLVNEVFAWKAKIAALRLGVEVDTGGLDDLNPSHETNVTIAELARSEFKKAATITAAEAEKQKLVLHGEGAAKAEQSRLESMAAGYKKIRDDLGIDGNAVIASETAKEALQKANTIVVGTAGVQDLFGLVAAGKQVLGNNPGESKTNERKTS